MRLHLVEQKTCHFRTEGVNPIKDTENTIAKNIMMTHSSCPAPAPMLTIKNTIANAALELIVYIV